MQYVTIVSVLSVLARLSYSEATAIMRRVRQILTVALTVFSLLANRRGSVQVRYVVRCIVSCMCVCSLG